MDKGGYAQKGWGYHNSCQTGMIFVLGYRSGGHNASRRDPRVDCSERERNVDQSDNLANNN